MMHDSILDVIGHTPLVRINKLTTGMQSRVFCKLEYLNPFGSVKDRIAIAIVKDAERRGLLRPGGRIIEASSGNTGISLAAVGATKGYRVTIVMPEAATMERKILLLLLGADIVLVPKEQGLAGVVAKAAELADIDPYAFLANQTENLANPAAHLQTGEEIWNDTRGEVDIVVMGSGTGGTLSGVARFLKKMKPSVKIVAVEPKESAVLSGGEPGLHPLMGMGPGFIPDTLDRTLIDDVEVVGSDDALRMSRRLVREEGILAGCTSGAVMLAALLQAQKLSTEPKTIVAVLTSFTERYLSTVLADEERKRAMCLPVESATDAYLHRYASKR